MNTSPHTLHEEEVRSTTTPAANTNPSAPRDPVTGTPGGPAPHDDKPRTERAPDELAHDIRRTRADISETLNEIEARISPQHLKEQVKGTVHETIDEVQDRLDPRPFIHNARRTMIDTIRENPIPSILAGLSLGYLIFNPSESRDRRVRGYDRVRGNAPYDYGRYNRAYDYDTRYDPYDDYGSTYERTYPARFASEESEDSTLTTARERTKEMAHQASERVSHLADQTQEHVQQWTHEAEEQMYRARNNLEMFVQDNPLAAGAIALGIGALIGGLLPPTQQERAMMGEASERLTHRMEDAASHTMSQAREAARHIADEARQATQEESDNLRDSAKHIAHRVKDVARDEAQHVKDTARDEARGVKDTAQEDGQTTRKQTTTAW